MNVPGFLHGRIFKLKIKFGGASRKEKEAYEKKWNEKCAECGVARRDHYTVTGHLFMEGGK